ncbi:MAG: hypothetical protein RLZZ74_3459 [Cyanobacteriota bacterium]|jgi:hypothetical protein
MKKLADRLFDGWYANMEGFFDSQELVKVKKIFRFRLEGEIALKLKAHSATHVDFTVEDPNLYQSALSEFWSETTQQPFKNVSIIERELTQYMATRNQSKGLEDIFDSMANYTYYIIDKMWKDYE